MKLFHHSIIFLHRISSESQRNNIEIITSTVMSWHQTTLTLLSKNDQLMLFCCNISVNCKIHNLNTKCSLCRFSRSYSVSTCYNNRPMTALTIKTKLWTMTEENTGRSESVIKWSQSLPSQPYFLLLSLLLHPLCYWGNYIGQTIKQSHFYSVCSASAQKESLNLDRVANNKKDRREV